VFPHVASWQLRQGISNSNLLLVLLRAANATMVTGKRASSHAARGRTKRGLGKRSGRKRGSGNSPGSRGLGAEEGGVLRSDESFDGSLHGSCGACTGLATAKRGQMLGSSWALRVLLAHQSHRRIHCRFGLFACSSIAQQSHPLTNHWPTARDRGNRSQALITTNPSVAYILSVLSSSSHLYHL
jgi:hypothetical protein